MTDQVTNQGVPATPAAPATPAPDTPEYVAHMSAVAEGKDPAAAVAALKAEADAKANAEAAAGGNGDPTPRLTDEPKENTEGQPEKKEGETPPEKKTEETKESTEGTTPTLAELFDSGDFASGFNAEKLPDSLTAALKATGLNDTQIAAMHEQFRAGQQALSREATGALYKAAGGKENFDALVTWGQKNLTNEQRQFYDGMLNGPDAAATVQVLMQKMNAGRDPRLVDVNGMAGGNALAAFRTHGEMVEAMADPRYQTSETYRNEVQSRVAKSQF